jgi:hypothetical protein
MRELHPTELIDRSAERELFGEVASFTTPARMLTICDGGGRGKSSLLKRLHYDCVRGHPRRAAALIDLSDKTLTEFSLLEEIYNQIADLEIDGSPMGTRFARFKEYNDKRLQEDETLFDDDARSTARNRGAIVIKGRAGARGGVRDNAKNTGVNIGRITVAGRRGFTENQHDAARKRCIDAFFEDLPVVCATLPLILIFDVWERCEKRLRDWIVERLLRSQCCHPNPNRRPAKLAVVIAGRPASPEDVDGMRPDDFRDFFQSDEEREVYIKSIKSLSDWETAHVKEFMQLHGYDPADVEVEALQTQLKRGVVTLEKAKFIIGQYTPAPRPAYPAAV